MTWLLVFLGIGIGALVGSIFSWVFVIIEKPIQWGGKSAQEWNNLGVGNPGERLTIVSFIFGLLSTTLSRFIAYMSGLLVFIWREEELSVIPMLIVAAILLVKDYDRVRKFQGNSGQPTEIGYLVGGLVGLVVFLFSKNYFISLF